MGGVYRRGTKLWLWYFDATGARIFEPTASRVGEEARARKTLEGIERRVLAEKNSGVPAGELTLKAYGERWIKGRSVTVLDNVRLPLLRRGTPHSLATHRALEVLTQVGLEAAVDRRPEHLSGGMKKRVGIARAIVAAPAVLLADDPFAGLDPVTEAQIAALLLKVSKGKTLIVAQPDPTAALLLPTHFKLHAAATAEAA